MIRERIDPHFCTVSLTPDDVYLLQCALEGHVSACERLDPESAGARTAPHAAALAAAFSIAQDVMERGGDGRPELVPDRPAADPAPAA